MPKSSKDHIQEDERKILTELQKNCKQNIDTIAKNCGFSRKKVYGIIKRLEDSKKIWGYSAIVSPEALGQKKFIISLKQSVNIQDIINAEKVNLDEIKNYYVKIGVTIESSYYTHGEYDWIIIFTAIDIKRAKLFINLLYKRFPGLVEKINLSQILHSPRDHYIFNPLALKVKDFL